MAAAAALPDFEVPNSSIKMKSTGFPSLTGTFLASYFIHISIFLHQSSFWPKDGKTKIFWSKCTHGSKACWVCYAYGEMLSKDFRGLPQFEPKELINLMFGFGQCHTRMRVIRWLLKFAYNKDFKNWEARYVHIWNK